MAYKSPFCGPGPHFEGPNTALKSQQTALLFQRWGPNKRVKKMPENATLATFCDVCLPIGSTINAPHARVHACTARRVHVRVSDLPRPHKSVTRYRGQHIPSEEFFKMAVFTETLVVKY